MKKELDQKLVQDFPLIFANRYESAKETAMCWGFECDDGWYWLIRNLCSHLQFDTDHNKAPQVVAAQVKEKFGTLRFYVDTASERQDVAIDFAESLSRSICEICGSTDDASQTKGGWIKTLCSQCMERENGKAS